MRDELKELLYVLSETMKYVHQRSYHKMNNTHMYPGQPKLLSIIKANEGITQKDLAEKNMCKPATITGMLNKLEANHFVYRVPDEVDKRILRVYLTPEGQSHAKQAESFIVSLVEQLFDGFSEEELHTLIKLSKKMKSNISNNEKS
jgi:DNA-binding MarR family transcriptional regulator